MCTYNLTLNDSLVNGVKGTFQSQAAIKKWMEQQLERMLRQIVVDDTAKNVTMRKINVCDRIKALSAVPASTSTTDYKDDLLDVMSEKY